MRRVLATASSTVSTATPFVRFLQSAVGFVAVKSESSLRHVGDKRSSRHGKGQEPRWWTGGRRHCGP